MINVQIQNLATHVPERLTVYELLTELNLKQLEEMKEMVDEVTLRLKKNMYFREDLDELNNDETFYRWSFNECWDTGGENIWYVCEDYKFEGGNIILHRSIPEDIWTAQFETLLQKYDTHPGDTRHYLKDDDECVIHETDVNEIVKRVENYIRKNKYGLERV